ncbi:hypothetical protein HDU97_001637 [Phlyctochytrium planicorne]|nr:hypothetical protein HDU97_001637 [Phlyctochytrium planicorne]
MASPSHRHIPQNSTLGHHLHVQTSMVGVARPQHHHNYNSQHSSLKLNNKLQILKPTNPNKQSQMPASTPVAIPSFAPIADKPNAAARNPAKKVPPPANLPSGRSFI